MTRRVAETIAEVRPVPVASGFPPERASEVRAVVGAAETEHATFLLFDREHRTLHTSAQELARLGVASDHVIPCRDASEALRALLSDRSSRVVALLAWPFDDVDARSLVRLLGSRGAVVLALVPPDLWDRAPDAIVDGADDVVLTPAPAEAIAASAVLAAEAMLRRRPAPWHRARAVLREALAHPSGGEVIVRSRAAASRILVSQGRIAWIHDDADRLSLVERLETFNVHVAPDELAEVLAESARSGHHFADVMTAWGLADGATIKDAVRLILNARLKAALSDEDAVAVFLPPRWRGAPELGFTSEELGVARATIAPRGQKGSATVRPLLDDARLTRIEALTLRVRALDGCVAAAVLHYGGAAVVSADGDAERLPLAWELGSALAALGDAAADTLATSDRRIYVARRLPGDGDCFVYAVFDLGATTIAWARRGVATALESP